MSYLLAAPAALVAAASDITEIGSNLDAANTAAAAPTTRVLAAAADEISTQVAAVFSAHAQGYQQLSAQAAAFHDRFVLALSSGANAYAAAETNAVRTLTNAISTPTQASAAALPVALAAGSIGSAIEDLYLAVEPWVQYGFNVASYAVGWLPWIGILAPQINFFYYLFEPMVQSVLFNAIDFLGGTVTFSQGLNNIWAATTASINQFLNTEINWVLGFFPPIPPLPPIGAAVPSSPV